MLHALDTKPRLWIRVAGTATVVLSLVGAVADLLLIYAPGLTIHPFISLLSLPPVRVLTGYLIGLTVIPWYILGWGTIYVLLRQAAPIQAFILLLLGIIGTTLGVVTHVVIGMLLQTLLMFASSPTRAVEVTLAFGPYLAPVLISMYAVTFIASLLFALIVIRHETPFPAWSILTTPSITQLAFVLLSLLFRSLGDLLIPTHQNLSIAVFIAAAMVFTRTASLQRS